MSATTTPIDASRQFTAHRPCPICGGHDRMARHKGERCHGYFSADGRYAYCSREERAGSLNPHPNTGLYAHRIDGRCKCGSTHVDPTTGTAPRASAVKPRVVKTYDYTDEQGDLLYQVCRTRPKGFFQRRPDGKGGWINKVGNVRHVLYRLPLLLAAEGEEFVFVTEGEKDADVVARLGCIATTNAMGARKWRPEYSEGLRDRHVVLLQDNDNDGSLHCQMVGGRLRGVAATVRILCLPDLPEHGDVSDWIDAQRAAGRDDAAIRDELLRLADQAKVMSATNGKDAEGPGQTETEPFRWASSIEPVKVEFLWEPYIPRRKVTTMDGDPGVGKSYLSLAIATGVSLGYGLPGLERRDPENVIIFTAEDGLADTVRPRLEAMGADLNRIALYEYTSNPLVFDDEGLQKIEATIAQTQATLAVFDTLTAFVGSKVDLYRPNETRPVITKLANIAERHNAAILLLRHLTKGTRDRAIYRGIGSIDIAGAARSGLLVGFDPNDKSKRALFHIKANCSATGEPRGYALDRGEFEWTSTTLTEEQVLAADTEQEKPQLHQAIHFLRTVLGDGQWHRSGRNKEGDEAEDDSVETDAKRAGVSWRTVQRAKAALGVATRKQGMGRGSWWEWALGKENTGS